MLRDELTIPVIGVVEPGARAAVRATRNGHIGVIGTAGTIKSGAYERAIRALDAGRCASRRAPARSSFRSSRRDGSITRPRGSSPRVPRAARCASDVDTLVLGCTHYPLLKPLIARRARARRHAHRQRGGDGARDAPRAD